MWSAEGKYLRTQTNGKAAWNGDEPEQFEVVASRGKLAVRDGEGRYIGALPNETMRAGCLAVGEQEEFRVVPNGSGGFAIQATNLRYVAVQSRGADRVTGGTQKHEPS